MFSIMQLGCQPQYNTPSQQVISPNSQEFQGPVTEKPNPFIIQTINNQLTWNKALSSDMEVTSQLSFILLRLEERLRRLGYEKINTFILYNDKNGIYLNMEERRDGKVINSYDWKKASDDQVITLAAVLIDYGQFVQQIVQASDGLDFSREELPVILSGGKKIFLITGVSQIVR